MNCATKRSKAGKVSFEWKVADIYMQMSANFKRFALKE